ncbi:MAG: mechanosensitive ion channel [Nevskia sp.]|nr:mechanosensitive ion channel [Nevskia sp.]
MICRALLLSFCLLLISHLAWAQPGVPAPGISADQARTALDVLNDPKKRAAFAATLDAIVKAQPVLVAPAAAGTATPGAAVTLPAGVPPASTAIAAPAQAAAPGAAAPGVAAPPVAETSPPKTTVEGLTIPLAPDSLGAQLLVSASDFVSHAGVRAVEGLHTVRSVPLLWGWAVVMTTSPWARDMLADVAWRLAVALAVAASIEYGLRRLMRRPIASLEAIAPNGRHGRHPHERDDHEPAPAEAEAANLAPGEADEAPCEDADEESAAREASDDDTVAEESGDDTTAEEPDRAPPPSDAFERAEAGDVEAPVPRPRRRPSPWTLLRRVPLVLARLVLELVPVLGLAVAGHLVAGSSLGGLTVSRLVILAVIDAYAACSALLCVARMLLSPGTARLRLLHMPDATANYAMRWIRRLVLITVFGYALGEVGLLLGLSDMAHEAVQKAVGLLLHVCLAIIVIQNRRRVRGLLRAPAGATSMMAKLRNRIAVIWHWIALFFLVAIWLVYAVEVPHGFSQVLRFFGLTALVLILARLSLLLVLGFIDRALRVGPATAERYPGIEARLRLYHPALVALASTLIYLVVAVALLQVYGLGALTWLLSSMLGQRIISAVVTLGVTLLLAFTVWEGTNVVIQSHLAKLQREAQMARSARLRTLLPLLRSTLLIAILVVAGLMVLSEIGVNIAPLLAGAGIVGVAIGFGSQKLVQDLITGIFLLLENAMQVGDWVTVSGLSGTVEALSVRTIRLRAGDGSVHIIPFSAVTSVTNVNRGLGNAAVNVSVAYDEDTDRVSDLLKDIVAGMRKESAFSDKMLSDLQLWGVDKVDGASVTIAGQVVCTDSGRWAVQREFNRRMKQRFQELGIQIYNPMRSISVTELPPAPADRGTEEEAPHAESRAAD